MSFCFGFISNDAEKMGCALSPFRSELVVPEGAPHGWGLAYYQAGQPLLKKQPKPITEELDFTRAMDNLRSNIVLGHVRNATVGGQRTENTHPFRLRTWTFCHCGTVDRFEQIKDDILKSIPDFIRRNIRGKTDSEYIFHLFLSFLNDTGRLDDHRLSPEVAARALASTFTYLDRLVVDNGGQASATLCLATDGCFLIGFKRGMELAASRHGTYNCPDSHGKIVPAPQLRAVVLLGGRSPRSPGWEVVTDRSIVIVDSQLDIRTFNPGSNT